jgi:hypothetical protein
MNQKPTPLKVGLMMVTGAYNGKNGLATSKITDWHIGGRDTSVVALIKEVLNA